MGFSVSPPSPVLFLVAAFSRHDGALDWARTRMELVWGPIALESPRFDFADTNYYDASMGSGLKKTFFAWERPVDPGVLAERKLTSNAWEAEYAGLGLAGEPRPLNLDPGYIALGKLVLASTKDFAHRIYLAHGIFAEITLYYRHGQWETHPWTFPDYRRPEYHAFFNRCRDYLHRLLRAERDR